MEALLNLVWVLLAVAGFAALVWQSRRAHHSCAQIRFGQLLAVALVVLSLFPAVSASDDMLRYQFLFGNDGPGLHQRQADASPLSDGLLLSLVRFFDSLENFTTATGAELILVLLLLGLVATGLVQLRRGAFLAHSGRAPPAVA